MTSPMNRHIRAGSAGVASIRRPVNAKAAAERMARLMANQTPADEDEDEDDLLYDNDSSVPSAGIGLAGGRHARARSPMSVRRSVEQALPSSRPQFSRTSATPAPADQPQPPSARSPSFFRVQPKPVEPVDSAEEAQQLSSSYTGAPSLASSIEQPSSARSVGRPNSVEQPSSARSVWRPNSIEQPSSARSVGRPNSIEQPLSARSVGRPNLRVKTAMVPPSAPTLVRPVLIPAVDSQHDKNRDKRFSLDFGTFKYKEPSGQQSSSALQDELDMLQEENESLLEKLRIAEERYEESELRTKQLEKQIASLGDGVSLEGRLLSRKEAELQKRETALKAAAETYGGSSDEIATLRTEVETARDEATSAMDQLRDVESEVKSLRITTQRMILTQEEMEEVVLKRCWLARCWGLCVREGIHADIAAARHEYWSTFASRPVEVILAAGRKAKEENSSISNDLEERENILQAQYEIPNKPNVESMLLVERGLRELTLLKVEEAIAISMAQKRRSCLVKSSITEELRLPSEGLNFAEAFELSPDEAEDVLLKQAWLLYIWRRAKNQGLEPDIAEDKLLCWINQADKQPNSQDAVDVERGLMELRKLGVETKLWEESRRLIDPDSTQKTLMEIEFQMLS